MMRKASMAWRGGTSTSRSEQARRARSPYSDSASGMPFSGIAGIPASASKRRIPANSVARSSCRIALTQRIFAHSERTGSGTRESQAFGGQHRRAERFGMFWRVRKGAASRQRPLAGSVRATAPQVRARREPAANKVPLREALACA